MSRGLEDVLGGRGSRAQVANEIVDAKRAGLGYEGWLRARMPDDYANEFVHKHRKNEIWREQPRAVEAHSDAA